MSFPVVADIWNTFEGAIKAQAKKLVEDIAKFQGVDHKELWDKVRPMIKVGLMDAELPETGLCPAPLGSVEGAIRQRCRAPCLIGFSACPSHINSKISSTPGDYKQVRRIFGLRENEKVAFYIDKDGNALDVNGEIQGRVKDDILYLYEVCEG